MEFNIIQTFLSFILGGGLVGVLTIRQTKEGKSLDNATKLVNEYKDLLESYKDQCDVALKRVDLLQEEVSKLRVQVSTLKQQLATSNLLYRNADILRCEKLSCISRTPPLKKDALLDIIESDENVLEHQQDADNK